VTAFQGKNILVVGGSGVLGANLVTSLMNQGATVIGTATSNESASAIPETGNPRVLLNLADQSSINSVALWLSQSVPNLDGVIFAGGRVGFGTSEQTTDAQFAALMQVNFLGQAALINQLLPKLRASALRDGKPFIAAITGVVAEKAFPGMSAYCASKTAMSSYLSALKTELRRDKIQVLDARPGHTETGLASRPLFGTAPSFPTGMTPEHVTSVVLNAIAAGASEVPSSQFQE
jgi:cyclic-di-GMP-binding biofilm dispersal mediator protein